MFMRNLKTGTKKKIEFEKQIHFRGNWNYKSKLSKPVCSKPIGVVTIEDIELVFAHQDLLDLLSLYLEADLLSVSMIKSKQVDTGDIKTFETLFNDKILEWVKKSKGDMK